MAVGLVLGGGAPNLTLMTGALLALDEAGVEFKVITTTGAGMVVGLMYAAPRQEDGEDWVAARRRLLRGTREWGIDDAIYRSFPVNYKIFQKPGKLAEEFSRATIPFLWSIPRETRRQRLLGDTLAFWAAAVSPTNLTPGSRGLCQPPPWIEHLVDFDKLQQNLAACDRKFRLSAYCIDTNEQAPETFNKEEITEEHFKAALAMPFIYEPYSLWDEASQKWKNYIEGSALQTLELNPDNVMVENDIDFVIYFDLMGNPDLIGQPRWLLDAWGKSIVAPLTRIAEQDIELFWLRREKHRLERETMKRNAKAGEDHAALRERDRNLDPNDWDPARDPAHYHPYDKKTRLRRMDFKSKIPEEQLPYMLDWSHSNMSTLFDCGYKAGKAFLCKYGRRLDLSMKLDPHRAVRKGLDPDHEAHQRPEA